MTKKISLNLKKVLNYLIIITYFTPSFIYHEHFFSTFQVCEEQIVLKVDQLERSDILAMHLEVKKPEK